MLFEYIWDVFLICVFSYVVYAAVKEAKDLKTNKWSSIVQAGSIMAIILLIDFLHLLLGGCEAVLWKEYIFLNIRDLGYCNRTVELNYTIIAALVVAALTHYIVRLYRSLR